jgi:4-amino-4-deoxy-L-arabinose transferase-like glycosyltransferase
LSVFDQIFYLGIGYDIAQHGQFTNGFMYDDPADPNPAAVIRPPGMRFTPLYPALVAAASWADPAFARAMACQVQNRGQNPACPHGAPLIRVCQFLLLAGIYWLIWWCGGVVLRSRTGAWASLAIALLTAPELLNYANYVMTEITALALYMASIAAVLKAGQGRRKLPWMLLAGFYAGLAALTRPAFFDLLLAAGLAGLILAARARRPGLAAAFLAAGLLTISPWIARNFLVLGTPALTQGYGAHVLNERIAFDEMTWPEYGKSFICWLPDGNAEGNALFGPDACRRFQWNDSPDNFYAIGNGPLMQQSLKSSGGWPEMFDYLMRTYILAHPIKHFLVTIPLALRGAWISNYWGFALMPICAVRTIFAFRRRDTAFLVLSLPAWFMLLFAAAISVNQTRYNLMLIPPFAIAGAGLVTALNPWRRVAQSPTSPNPRPRSPGAR